MRNLWLKFGCFLTGYNYQLVKNSSEAVAKAVMKNLSAMLIITMIWAFIGYAFTQRYLHGDMVMSLFGAIVAAFIIIQIERQITLSVMRNKYSMWFRFVIGLVMAFIGSVILDQIIYKDDIEKNKIENVQNEVNRILPVKTHELDQQIQQLSQAIYTKEAERAIIIQELGRRPMIPAPSTMEVRVRDSVTGQMRKVGETITNQSVTNPKTALIPQIDVQLKYLNEQKNEKENEKLNIRQLLETDIHAKVGFLDELQVLFSILLSSNIALFVWLLIFLIFFLIELFVLSNKYGDGVNDYDRTVLHQMETRIKMLEKLADK